MSFAYLAIRDRLKHLRECAFGGGDEEVEAVNEIGGVLNRAYGLYPDAATAGVSVVQLNTLHELCVEAEEEIAARQAAWRLLPDDARSTYRKRRDRSERV